MKPPRPAATDNIAATLVTALFVAAAASQYFRRMPHFFEYQKGLLSADSLVFPVMVSQLTSGRAEMSDWIANPAQYWVTEFFPLVAFGFLTDGGLRLSLALLRSAELLLLIASLAALFRVSSGASWPRSFQVSAVSVAALTAIDHLFGGLHTMTPGAPGHRTANISLFLLACAGAARVAASGRANHPLTWLYLALCFAFGAEDALISVQVVLPVWMASLWWWRAGREGRAWGMAAAATLGLAMNYAGHAANVALLQFEANEWRLQGTGFEGGADAAAPLLSEGRHPDAVVAFLSFLASEFTDSLGEELLGASVLNFVFLLCAVPVAAWTLTSRAALPDDAGKAGVKECAGTFLRAMYWSLALTTVSAMVLVKSEVDYAHTFLWTSPLVLAVAWLPGLWRRPWFRGGATGMALLCLAAYLSFFRPDILRTGHAECAAESGVSEGAGLSRGMVTFWHSYEALATSGVDTMHVMYGVEKHQTESYALPIRHVGNVRHTQGRADYVIVDLRINGKGVVGFRKQFGLPSRIEECGWEAWYLYGDGRLSADDLGRRPSLHF